MDAAQRAELGKLVRERRESRGWSQERLAQEAGVSENTVISIEQGNRRTQDGKLRPVLTALGIGLEESADVLSLDGVPEDARIFLRVAAKRLAVMDEAARSKVLADVYPRLLL